MKVCSVCKEELPLVDFYKQSANKDGLAYRCKSCDRVARRAFSQSTRGKKLTRDANRRHKYNMSPEEFENLWELQNGKCAVCSIELDDSFVKQHKPNKVVIDHNHKTGKVRGLLCTKCNKGIGLLGDTGVNLYLAWKYLLNAEIH